MSAEATVEAATGEGLLSVLTAAVEVAEDTEVVAAALAFEDELQMVLLAGLLAPLRLTTSTAVLLRASPWVTL